MLGGGAGPVLLAIWARADAAAAAEPARTPELAVAQRVPPPAGDGTQPMRPGGVILGEGWGCASSASGAGLTWQCWEAGPRPQAWPVPWLAGKVVEAGPDRICQLARPALEFRCWQRPRFGEREARELPASWQWLNPHHVKWDQAYARGDRVGTAVVGGTFACLQTTRDEGIFCLGDDRFGQLGGSSVPGPDAGAKDAAFVRGT